MRPSFPTLECFQKAAKTKGNGGCRAAEEKTNSSHSAGRRLFSLKTIPSAAHPVDERTFAAMDGIGNDFPDEARRRKKRHCFRSSDIAASFQKLSVLKQKQYSSFFSPPLLVLPLVPILQLSSFFPALSRESFSQLPFDEFLAAILTRLLIKTTACLRVWANAGSSLRVSSRRAIDRMSAEPSQLSVHIPLADAFQTIWSTLSTLPSFFPMPPSPPAISRRIRLLIPCNLLVAR